jgi:hypothetical protein
MASSSSASAAASLTAALGSPPTEKLTRQNHLFWKTQVLPALRGAQVMDLGELHFFLGIEVKKCSNGIVLIQE